MQGASVFINNTSRGTTADKSGYFEITDVPAGKHELIISSIGYETTVYSFSAEALPVKLKVVLEVKVKELENVIVEPSVEEGWNKWGKLFTDNFIGSTPNAAFCRIKNEKAIRFRHYKKSNRVIAYCDEPLIFENKALGYTIKYQLENFEVNFKEHSSAFSGYPFFEEIEKKRKGLQNKWRQKRDKAYYGSMMHFMRSLYLDSLHKEGFEVRRMVKVPNFEKQRVKRIYVPQWRPPGSSNVRVITTSSGMNIQAPQKIITDSTLSADSVRYYERVLEQKDFNEVYGRAILTADSLIVKTENDYKILFFNDYLYITYKNEFEEEAYLRFYGENRSVTFQRSLIWLTNSEGVGIYQNGTYYPPQSVYSMAYWGWSEKMADFLPVDYEPGNEP